MFREQKPDGSSVFKGYVAKVEVRRLVFQKDMKNKVRRFYNDFLEFVEAFITHYEQDCLQVQGETSQTVERELRDFSKKYRSKPLEQ